MSCGFIVDGSGRKMSKSLGNVVDPADVIASFGADVLRLWVGSIDSSQDVGIDDEILKRTSEAYRRFRNTFRFLLSNLYDYSLGEACDWDGLLELDRWALVRLERVAEAATAAYEANRFHLAYHAIYDYVVSDLSAVYMDALKDRLYSNAPASRERKSAQTALANILEVLVRLLAPLITFTCDEVLENYPEGMSEGKPEAITLADWPSSASLVPQIPAGEAERLNGVFEHVLAARDVVTKALEDARGAKSIGKSQEAAVTLTLPEDALGALAGLPKGTLEELFIVSAVELVPAGGTGQAAGAPAPAPAAAMSAQIAQAAGEKCPRCWNVREPAGDAAHPGLCQRCLSVLAQMGGLDGAQGQNDAACAHGGEGLAG
jgi:isoleucyl-tRNA synthetase